MTQQPNALRLADELDLYATSDAHQRNIEQAADELRRLHESNTELLDALNKALPHIDVSTHSGDTAWSAARAAITKAEGEMK